MKNNSYEDMNPELRKEVARDSVKKTTFLRILITVLLIGLVVYLRLSGVAAVVLILAAIMNLASLIPVWILMNQNMKDSEDGEITE